MRRKIEANLLALVVFLLAAVVASSAQFLFTYEINPESDSRAPKSSLFDPSSFKIVTPSQLQNSYQKISAQLDATVAAQSPQAAPPPPPQVAAQAVPGDNELATTARSEPQSLLKQTSAALQSFAELFSLSSPTGSSSPSPISSLPSVHQPASNSNNNVNQEAEARSLHEHWTQQQQRSHQHQHQQEPALNSLFTTASSTNSAQQPSQASYWLTANPLNAPNGNYLVQVKPQQAAEQANGGAQHAHMMDNLLAVGQQRQARSSNKPLSLLNNNNLAQNSFLQSTPTSYYPSPSSVESSTRASHASLHQDEAPVRGFEFSSSSTPISTGPRMSMYMHTTVASVQPPPPSSPSPLQPLDNSLNQQQQQLQLPANIPENFVASSLNKPQHKSAEESLLSYRQQQQLSHQHEQQNQVFAAQQQLVNNHQAPQASQQQQQQQQQQQRQPANDIPKISPQIYESFLLQQRDQHEKHLELLKQQQELNKLLEQKQKQQDAAEARRRKKKEELDKEARKKALREQEAIKKAKLEAEEREARRRRDEEERKRVEEERKYREYLEARERERRQREEEEELKRRQLREMKLKQEQREREAAAELLAKQKAAAEEEAAKKKADEAKYLTFLRQQEELKKLLELKQREDEATQQQRRKQAATSQPQRNQASRARSLAQEHKDRAGSGSWGAPIRLLRTSTPAQQQDLSSTSPAVAATTSAPISSSTTLSTLVAEQVSTTRRRFASKKQKSLGDERLIRQKIPLYSGPGQYGLYRGNGGANNTIANDLAALLDSVSLPSTSTTTTTTTTTTPAPEVEPTTRRFYDTSSSLSPLLDRSLSIMPSTASPSEPFFEDDVPRRPVRTARERSLPQPRPAATNQLTAASSSSSRQQTSSKFNETLPAATQTTRSTSSGPQRAHIGLASLPPDSDNDGIPGRAGHEYPVLSSVPPTSFSCSKQPLNGYYADTETACQVVHLCQGGVQSSILCPNGTIFNQEKFSCQWWYEVNCSRAPIFYQLNDNLYRALPGTSASAPAPATTTDKDSTAPETSEKKKAVLLLRKEKQQANILAAS